MIEPATIGRAASLIHRLAAGRWRRERSTVILMVDGVGVDVARSEWQGSCLRTLVSTFPTTSTTAWLTALTGADIATHLVPGMAYRVDSRDVVAIDPVPAELVATDDRVISVFERLVHEGVHVVVLPGMIARYPGPWSRALWSDTSMVAGEPHLITPDDPRQTVTEVVGAIERRLGSGPLVVAAYVDIDSSVHREGYSTRVREALRALDRAALRWRRVGVATIAVSDHGAVHVEPDEQVRERFDTVLASGKCAPVAGGAGRVRWLYSGAGASAARLAEVLRAAIGDVAWVGTRAEAVSAAMLPARDVLLRRIGEVVAVAVDRRFPVPDEQARFEHGAASAQEAHVPFGVW